MSQQGDMGMRDVVLKGRVFYCIGARFYSAQT